MITRQARFNSASRRVWSYVRLIPIAPKPLKGMQRTRNLASLSCKAFVEYDDEKVTEAKLRDVINATGLTVVEE